MCNSRQILIWLVWLFCWGCSIRYFLPHVPSKKKKLWFWVGWCFSIIIMAIRAVSLAMLLVLKPQSTGWEIVTSAAGTELGNPVTIITACLVTVTTLNKIKQKLNSVITVLYSCKCKRFQNVNVSYSCKITTEVMSIWF